ncbi:hypothetical protein Ancab_017929 [Ancistrocladus abbreviatus]
MVSPKSTTKARPKEGSSPCLSFSILAMLFSTGIEYKLFSIWQREIHMKKFETGHIDEIPQFKLKCDAAQDHKDSLGTVKACGCKRVFTLCPSITAEALALHFALREAKALPLLPLVLETDALQLVKEWRTSGLTDNDLSRVVMDARIEAYCLNIRTLLFRFREANRVAHHLAKWTLSSVNEKLWFDSFPREPVDVGIKELEMVAEMAERAAEKDKVRDYVDGRVVVDYIVPAAQSTSL